MARQLRKAVPVPPMLVLRNVYLAACTFGRLEALGTNMCLGCVSMWSSDVFVCGLQEASKITYRCVCVWPATGLEQ